MSFLGLFQAELLAHSLSWCDGSVCCETSSHKRGFVRRDEKTTVHLASTMTTRAALHRGLHEIAHCIQDETGLRRYEKEAQANRWAEARMRELGVAVSRKVAAAGRSYARRMKRWGNNIKKGRKS